ncbi:Hypothetical predicted protein [Xyrichtys novacula]|uniref:Uncharacterized protein n=1 Tax=Xyrichtys novacula TaxID=13765 RepID=A0AAV1FDC7_XYRNO|nr:Hypothetical predicted protein [Xyrichtys novacula]
MLESNYERWCLINLPIAEKGRQYPQSKLVDDQHREYYSQESELRSFQGSFSGSGSGSCTFFLCGTGCLKESTVCGCPGHLDGSEAQPVAPLFKAHRDNKWTALLFPEEQEKAPVKSAQPNLSEFLIKERMQREKPPLAEAESYKPLSRFLQGERADRRTEAGRQEDRGEAGRSTERANTSLSTQAPFICGSLSEPRQVSQEGQTGPDISQQQSIWRFSLYVLRKSLWSTTGEGEEYLLDTGDDEENLGEDFEGIG